MTWWWTLMGFCSAFALASGTLNLLAWRRYQRLNEVLQELCTSAWIARRWPLIDAWMEFAGLEMKVRQRGRE